MKLMKKLLLAACVLLMSACARDIVDFSGSIKGIVKDYTYGQFISNCLVTLNPGGDTYTTSGDGIFEFLDLTPGQYTLTFSKAGYENVNKNVNVVAGEIVNADCLMQSKSPFATSESLINFGDLADNYTFFLYNNSDSDTSYSITNIPDWASFSRMSGSVSAGGTEAITVTVYRDAVGVGNYAQTVTISYSGKGSGSVPIRLQMQKVTKSAPTVTTAEAATTIYKNGFDIVGNIVATGGLQIIEYGHCWSTQPTPTTNDNKTSLGITTELGAFTSSITGLSTNTAYYVRAYATNSLGTSYGSQVVVLTQNTESNKWDGTKAKSFAKGKGNAANPYIIETGAQLVLMKDYSSSHFKLNKDIDLDNRTWPAINLSGSLDGNGHTIYNLKPACNDRNIGFISTLTGTLKNLTIDGVNIDAEELDYIGAFVGNLNGGNIDNCTLNLNSNSLILGYDYVGGIVGYIGYSGGSIKNCTVNSSAQNIVIHGNNGVGGIWGYTEEVKIGSVENCHVQADIYGNQRVGGIAGNGKRYGSESEIYLNCSYKGNISGDIEVGGIVGYGHNAIFQGCKAVANITVSDQRAGGISGNGACRMIGCYTDGTLTCSNNNTDYIGGLATAFGWQPEAYLCYSTMTSSHPQYYGLGNSVYPEDCATVASKGNGYITTGKVSCKNITEFLESAYSEYAEYYNFNNTWIWTGKVDGKTVNVSCPKLAWE